MDINTLDYEWNHGWRKPRGRADWHFDYEVAKPGAAHPMRISVKYNGMYSACKQQAIKAARAAGARAVWLAP